MDRREDYIPPGHCLRDGLVAVRNPIEVPMPKWVNHHPIDNGIRYNLDTMKTRRRDNKAHSKRKRK